MIVPTLLTILTLCDKKRIPSLILFLMILYAMLRQPYVQPTSLYTSPLHQEITQNITDQLNRSLMIKYY